MELCCISLGSNQAHPKQQLKQALQSLEELPGCQLDRVSSFYRTKAWGFEEQSDFINAACGLWSSLTPTALLHALQQIEQQQGRVREQKWGPRTLDLDIISFGERQIDEPRLQVPHPLFCERNFVLVPLAEIYPEHIIAGQSCLTWLQGRDISDCQREEKPGCV